MKEIWITCNETELQELIRKKTGKRVILPRQEMIQMLEVYEDKHSSIETSRKKLQVFVEKNLSALQTNLPCNGSNLVGKCTVYECTNFVHISCLIGASKLMESENAKN